MGDFSRVLIIVENLPVPFDRRVWMEATTLQKAGYQVSVISPQGNGFDQEYEVLEGVHIYRHPLPPEISSVTGYLREYAWAVGGEFRLAKRVWRERGGFDIVHVCNPPDLLFLVASWFKLFHGVRIVFDHHDLSPEMYEAKYARRDIFYHGLRWAERLTYAVADIVISTNESHRKVALTRGHKKPERVFVVRSAPDLARFRLLPPNPIYRQGRTHLVGYMGVMGEPEGVDYLLRAIQYITQTKQRRDIHFMLIGSGPAVEKLKALAIALGLSEFVEFTGFQMGDSLLERLSSCDVCVEPSPTSTYNENCTMNKILEYMALGKPIVQFELREGRRSAEDASLYATPNDEVELAEKILELLDDPGLRQQMGAKGRHRMETQLEWRHQAPKLLEAYQSIAQRR
ncbi:glycosyltransferase family 4 protein [Oculatella sp. LEGE 06141]|uniref:glycosyltransferase family 4 protein n=1 Tax=Oculatella sp. LEGE 06141 TaxID=1828648 RepID=UPI001880F7B5|nr:glycosyltransferase family 4 protein [Oculatella sp. LEGE 06141]MBE9179732.1 glycosyltransferase family 4 protein [Oculatella sp. LEGE 06141]